MFQEIHMYGAKAIERLQQLSAHHTDGMQVWSIMGNPYAMIIFYFPLFYNLSGRVGLKLIWVACLAEWLNTLLKWSFHGHRPYWWVKENSGPNLKQFEQTCETSPGSPSGHMMCAVAVSYCVFNAFAQENAFSRMMKEILGTGLALCLVMLGLSRCFLAAHFPHQVICGAVAGFCVGHVLNCWCPASAEFKRYLLASFGIILTGSVLLGFLRAFGVDPLWSVEKAEKNCAFPERIRHKHNVMAVLVRTAAALLGVGVGLVVTNDKQHWDRPTASWCRITGAVLSIVAAQMSAHLIVVTHLKPFAFYGTVAVKSFLTTLLVVVIASAFRRSAGNVFSLSCFTGPWGGSGGKNNISKCASPSAAGGKCAGAAKCTGGNCSKCTATRKGNAAACGCKR